MALTEREPARETVPTVIWPYSRSGGAGDRQVEGEGGVLGEDRCHEMSDPCRRFLVDDGI